MSLTAFSAVVLAAGRSTRMGSDKGLLEFEGRALWQRQRDLLRDAGASEILLSARPDQTWASRAEGFAAVVPDAIVAGGPLAGIAAALQRARSSHLAVLAVDLPRMQVAWFDALRARCREGVGIVGHRDRFYEPLAAFYPRELLPLAQAALERRELSLQRLIAAACAQGLLLVHEISAAEAAYFENWNDPPRP
jgi:molybdopterin-guanine dinucleotide biosynthesis protein A